MTLIKEEIYFLKADGRVPNGKRLEVSVNGKIVDKPIIQMSFNPSDHFRVVRSKILQENKPYKIDKLENLEESVLYQIRNEVRRKYSPKGIWGIFSKPKINVKYHNSHSTQFS